MKKLLCLPVLALCLKSANSYATCPPGQPADECMTVEAPIIGEGGGNPTIIGGIIGNPGGVGGGVTPATATSINAKGKKTAKDTKKKKEQENNKDEESWFDILLGLFTPEVAATDAAIDKISEIVRFHSDSVNTKKTLKRDPQTGEVIEETEESNCRSVGINDDKSSCTEIRATPYKDPADGRQKIVITISEVRSMKNPRHGIFERPYIFKYVNSFQFVAENEQDVRNFFADLWAD